MEDISYDSLLFPCEASELKVGDVALVKDQPCKLVEVHRSKTGKHGHMKCVLVGISLWNGKKYEDAKPGHVQMHKVEPLKRTYTLLYLRDEEVEVLDAHQQSLTLDMDKEDPLFVKLQHHVLTSSDNPTELYFHYLPVKQSVQLKFFDFQS